MTDTRPKLRDCPFCHTSGDDDEKILFVGNNTYYRDSSYEAGYSIYCTGCGVELHDEYRDEVVRLWNGEMPATDDGEEG